jgi:NADH-quinone oxidoreductase subunit N
MDISFLLAMKSELIITLIIFILLFLKIDGRTGNESFIRITYLLLFVNLGAGWVMNTNSEIFGGMFRNTPLLAFQKNVLNLATLIIALSSYGWLKNHRHLPEFFMLLLSSLLGMFFMLGSGHLLMFYLGLELSTIPLAALCNFDLEKKISSEAAMKMILSSAFSSGILLFGISMIYGATGALGFKELAAAINGSTLQVMAFILIFTGFAFKLSVVPFHLWTADVYEGSPVAVTAYLSVVSKGAMAFVFVTVLYTLFGSMAGTWYNMLALTSVITMITGNLFALRQNNLKRFLAFSSIAQVGYLLIGISGISQLGVASVVYFILIYLFSNLAAFAVISVISSTTGRETIESYRGLYSSNPGLALVLAIALFSLAGIPPTAGFFGKLFLLTSGARMANWPLIIIASLNLIISLYYYLRIVRAMFIDSPAEPIGKLSFSSGETIAFIVCVAGVLSVGFLKGVFETIFSLSANL